MASSFEESSTASCLVSPVLSESLVFQRAPETLKPVKRTLLDTLQYRVVLLSLGLTKALVLVF